MKHGVRLGAVERQMGEGRRLARAEAPPRGGWVRMAAHAVRDSRCITDGGEQGPSGGP